jgi:hypothetical protein
MVSIFHEPQNYAFGEKPVFLLIFGAILNNPVSTW